MKQKLYLFLILSLFYGLIMGFLLSSNDRPFFLDALVSGILFGAVVIIIMMIVQKLHLRKTGNAGKKVQLINQAEFKLEGTKEQVIELCRNSLDSIKNSSVLEINREAGLIRAKAGMTWYTWGDEITFQIESIGDHNYSVSVTSRPMVKTTLIDYGKNLDNIQKIKSYLHH